MSADWRRERYLRAVIMCNDTPICVAQVAGLTEREIDNLIYELKTADRDRLGRSSREWKDYDNDFHWRAIRVPYFIKP